MVRNEIDEEAGKVVRFSKVIGRCMIFIVPAFYLGSPVTLRINLFLTPLPIQISLHHFDCLPTWKNPSLDFSCQDGYSSMVREGGRSAYQCMHWRRLLSLHRGRSSRLHPWNLSWEKYEPFPKQVSFQQTYFRSHSASRVFQSQRGIWQPEHLCLYRQ